MQEYISFDSHKHYTLVEREDIESGQCRQYRVEHARGAIVAALTGMAPGTPVALEAIGNWYWIVGEIEQAGGVPKLVHPRKAKVMMGMINKSDALDVHGLNTLQRNKTLPTVWIAPPPLRDQRELTRMRMVLAQQRTRLKNRLGANLTKYALHDIPASDIFAPGARGALLARLGQLPEHHRWSSEQMLGQLDFVTRQIGEHEKRLAQVLTVSPEMALLMTMPGVGLILGAAMAFEIGPIGRFASAERLACYSGTVGRLHQSGQRRHVGKLRPDVNHYLRWAYVEAGNSIALNASRKPGRYLSQVYLRLKERRGHAKAIGAVARHLAEASYHVLSKKEPYRDPALKQGSSL